MPTLRYKVSKASANVKNESTKGRKPKKVAVVRKEPGSIGLSWAVDKDKSGKGKVDGGNVVDSNGELCPFSLLWRLLWYKFWKPMAVDSRAMPFLAVHYAGSSMAYFGTR